MQGVPAQAPAAESVQQSLPPDVRLMRALWCSAAPLSRLVWFPRKQEEGRHVLLSAAALVVGAGGASMAADWCRQRASVPGAHMVLVAHLARAGPVAHDPTLMRRCLQDIGAFYRLCLEAWAWVLRVTGGSTDQFCIWSSIPEQLRAETLGLLLERARSSPLKRKHGETCGTENFRRPRSFFPGSYRTGKC